MKATGLMQVPGSCKPVAFPWTATFGAAVVLALAVGPNAATASARISPCSSTEYTAAIGQTVKPARPTANGAQQLTLVLAGDTGFNPKDAPVDPRGFTKDRASLSFAESLQGVAGDIDGDLAFLNLETVVTDRNDLAPNMKGQTSPYNFRSHPAALDVLVDTGFNLFSLANNHSMDYGGRGAEETLYHMAVAGAAHPITYAGLGADFAEATKPGCLEADGVRLAFGATGIVTDRREEHRAGEGKPGQAAYRNRRDFEVVVNRLREFPADYRMLSIHYGLEGRVVPDKRQLDDWRDYAVREKGIDLVVGHHPHVAQGVERIGDSLIFYGLGNFLHPGTAEMKRFGVCRDYGLMAKVHLAKAGDNWTVGAIEAIPITGTHVRPARFSPAAGTQRIFVLNYLSGQLGDDGATSEGVRFSPRPDGTGLYCANGAAELGGKIGALCAGWSPAPPAPVRLQQQLRSACADKPFYGAGRKKRRTNTIFGFGQY